MFGSEVEGDLEVSVWESLDVVSVPVHAGGSGEGVDDVTSFVLVGLHKSLVVGASKSLWWGVGVEEDLGVGGLDSLSHGSSGLVVKSLS